MTLVEVVMAYREQYRIERGFGRFKGRPLLLTPLFLQTESRVEGLIHGLSLALRVLVMVEFLIRRPLVNTHSEVAGLYRWPATRTTASPTAELILGSYAIYGSHPYSIATLYNWAMIIVSAKTLNSAELSACNPLFCIS